MLAAVELHVERYDLAPLRPQGLLQERVAGILQHQPVVVRDDRFHAAVLRCPASLGTQHVDLGQVVARRGDQPGIGAHRIGELREDADDLAPLGIFQFAQLVVDLHDLDRFDVERTPRGRFVVDEALQLAFIGRGNRDHGLPFADRDLGVGIDDTGPFGGGEHRLQPLGGLPFAFADGAPNLQQGRRSIVPDIAETIDDGVDPLHDPGECLDAAAAGIQRRILPFAGEDERNDAADEAQRPVQGHHLPHVEERPFDTQFGNDMVDVGIFPAGKIVLHVEQQAHLVGKFQPPPDLARRGRESLFGELPAGGTHGAKRCNLFPKPVEADLLLEVCRINHLYVGLNGYCSRLSESRSALAAALAAFLSARSFIFSGLRPKSERWT